MNIPAKWKAVSVATMRTTPAEMRVMTNTRRQENSSRRKRKAKRSTKISDEDLHIAGGGGQPARDTQGPGGVL